MALSGGEEVVVRSQAMARPVSGIGAFSRVLMLTKMASIGPDTIPVSVSMHLYSEPFYFIVAWLPNQSGQVAFALQKIVL